MTDGARDVGQTTVVHLVRHGHVENPEGILYGRLDGYHLSKLGREMADRLGEAFAGRDIAAVVASPLDRAQETAEPIAARHGLPVDTDERLIEATNIFEGRPFGVGDGVLRRPGVWRHLLNPFRPSWGEPYAHQVARMTAAMADARDRVAGRQVVCVSHQLPIWVTRLSLAHHRLWHDPRNRQCELASVTSVTYVDHRVVAVAYETPAHDLQPARQGKGA